jgi:hypothetical protein
LEIYSGKQELGPYSVSNKPEDIVKRLICDIVGTNRNITFDNWYTSVPLAIYLLEKRITCIGTLRKNKKEIPVEFQANKMRAIGSCLFGFQKNITLVSHVPRKNKAVIALSTMHHSNEIDEETNKPSIIVDYNMTKGGVDTVDQLRAMPTP